MLPFYESALFMGIRFLVIIYIEIEKSTGKYILGTTLQLCK